MKEKSQRQLQVGERVKRILANMFIHNDMIVPKGAHITVVRADVSPDMKNAKIVLNIFGNSDRKKIMKEINEAAPYFRSRLASELTMRNTPELLFVLDETNEGAKKTLGILEEEAKKFK